MKGLLFAGRFVRTLSCLVWFLWGISGANASAGENLLYAISGAGNGHLLIISNFATAPVAYDLGDTGVPLTDIAVDPTTCRIYAVSLANLYELNRTNGTAQFIAYLGGDLFTSLEFDRDGQAYTWTDQLYKVDKTNGTKTLVGPVGYFSGGDLAIDVDGTIYGSTGGSVVRMNPSNGAGTDQGSFGFGGVFGLEIDTNGTMYASAIIGSRTDLYRITNGGAVPVWIGTIVPPSNFTNGFFVNGIAFRTPAGARVPPPLSITRQAGAVRLSFDCDCYRTYQVDSTLRLNLDPWFKFFGPIKGFSGPINFLVPTTNSSRFFRLTVE